MLNRPPQWRGGILSYFRTGEKSGDEQTTNARVNENDNDVSFGPPRAFGEKDAGAVTPGVVGSGGGGRTP